MATASELVKLCKNNWLIRPVHLLINIQSLLAAGAVWLNLGPQARGLPWRAEMQPNCPGYQERLCLSSWNRYSTRTCKARKNRTRKESFLARKKNDRNFQPCEIANIRPRAEICNLTWLESADSVLAKQVLVQSSTVHVRSQNLATFIRRSDRSVPWLQTCDIWWGINLASYVDFSCKTARSEAVTIFYARLFLNALAVSW